VIFRPARAARRAGGASGDTRDLLPSRLSPDWRPVKLRKQPNGYVSPSRNLHGARSQRRKTRRPTRDAGYQVRVGYHPTDREGARARNPTDTARARRRGDRMMRRRAFVGLVAVQPLRKPAIGWANVDATLRPSSSDEQQSWSS